MPYLGALSLLKWSTLSVECVSQDTSTSYFKKRKDDCLSSRTSERHIHMKVVVLRVTYPLRGIYWMWRKYYHCLESQGNLQGGGIWVGCWKMKKLLGKWCLFLYKEFGQVREGIPVGDNSMNKDMVEVRKENNLTFKCQIYVWHK